MAMKLLTMGTRTWSQTSSGDCTMLRTIFMIGLFAIGGLFVLKIAFGLFGSRSAFSACCSRWRSRC